MVVAQTGCYRASNSKQLILLGIIIVICMVSLLLRWDFKTPILTLIQHHSNYTAIPTASPIRKIITDPPITHQPTSQPTLQPTVFTFKDPYLTSIFDNCAVNDFMDILRIKWHNNTYCEWDFEPNECQAIHKMNYTQYIKVLQLLEINNVTIAFWGDSVTRRIGKTLDLFLNQKGDVHSKWADKTYKMAFPYTVYRQKITPHWHTEWTPSFMNVTTLLNSTKYLNKYYLVGKTETQRHIIIVGVGIWELYPQYGRGSVDQTYPILPGYIDNFMKWLYDNYYDKDKRASLNATDPRKRMHVILHTQTQVAIARGRYGYSQSDLQNLTSWWNLNLVKSAKKYGIPIFDAYHWSSYEQGYHLSLQETQSEEMYDHIDHVECEFCLNGKGVGWGELLRHQCVECEEYNCVHMRSNGRMILLQQIINAINILAHKEII